MGKCQISTSQLKIFTELISTALEVRDGIRVRRRLELKDIIGNESYGKQVHHPDW